MTSQKTGGLNLKAGDWVVVRSKAEILASLDKKGQLDKMPFMPEMLQYAGQKLQVSKRAHKTCDPINGLESRALPDTVHIGDLRCDGSAHADCQAGCLFFFKDAWLRPDRLKIFVVSDRPLAEIQPLIEAEFGSWATPATPAGIKQFSAPPPRPSAPHIVLVNRPDSPHEF